MCASVYVRHRQIVTFYDHLLQRPKAIWFWASRILMFGGFVSAFGVLLVANFQESNVLAVHMVGAMLAFLIGLIYCWGQTIFAYTTRPRMCPLWVVHVRLVLCLVGLAGFLGSEISGFNDTPPKTIENSNGTGTTELPFGHWPSDVAGYTRHVTATLCEWMMVLAFEVYIATFAVEFRQIEIATIEVRLPQSNSLGLNHARQPEEVKVTYR